MSQLLDSFSSWRINIQKNDFPEAYSKYCRSISIPIFPGMTENQIEKVISSIKKIGENNYRNNQ